MTKRLCTLVVNCSEETKSWLDSLGIWYETEPELPPTPANYALILIDNSVHDERTISVIANYLKDGGSILETGNEPLFFKSGNSSKYIDRFIADDTQKNLFRISYADFDDKLSFTDKGSDTSSLFGYEETEQKGYKGFLGFNLSSVFSYSGYTRKRFPSYYESDPDEIVSKISYGEVSQILEASIEKMFHLQGLPFIKKWHSPKKEPVFCFRIDSDFGDQESLDRIYSALEKHDLKGSWFLHVKAHEEWLDYFSKFNNHEIALHGYEHGAASSKEKIENNIRHGLSVLEKNGIEPKGYCTPYAIWNEALEKTLQNFDFKYSSEFTRAYDCLPFFDRNEHLQIPIHPVCTGSLLRQGYSNTAMQNYFVDTFQRKSALHQPVIFYHHPMQKGLEVFDKIFEMVKEKSYCNLTFLEFADFWHDRRNFHFQAFFEESSIIIESNSSQHWLSISNNSESFDLISSKESSVKADFKSPFKYDTSYLPSSEEIKDLSKNRLQLLKTNLIDYKNRYRL